MRVDSLRIRRGGSAASTLPGWRKIDSHGPFSCDLRQSRCTSRSDLELDESVEDPEAADACSVLKPGSQYDAGASVASQASRASPAKIGVPVHNLAFASAGGVIEGVSEGGSL